MVTFFVPLFEESSGIFFQANFDFFTTNFDNLDGSFLYRSKGIVVLRSNF